jgi:hypothetical protein
VFSNPRRAPVYFRLHHLIRAVGSGGIIGSLCVALYTIMIIELCFNFMSTFYAFTPHVVSYLFSYLAFSSSCAIPSQAGLLEVPAAYRGSLTYFLARSLLLLNGCSSRRLMLTGGPECATYFCTLSVCTLPP